MNKTKIQKLDDMTKVAAYRVAQAMSVFDGEPENIRGQAEQIVMQRYARMKHGDPQTVIDMDLKFVDEQAPAPSTVEEPAT